MIKGIIFDLDGVIIKGTECDFLAWQKIFSYFGKECSFKLYKEFSGMRGNEIIKKYLKVKSEQEAVSFDNKKEEYFIKCLEKGRVKLGKGLNQFLEKLKNKGIKTAIATAAKKEKVKAIIEHFDLKHYFNEIVCSEDVSKGKPDPESFLKAAEKLNLTPKECIVIEDAPNGIQAAKKAKMKVIAITTTHKKEELKEADKIIDSFDELNLKLLEDSKCACDFKSLRAL